MCNYKTCIYKKNIENNITYIYKNTTYITPGDFNILIIFSENQYSMTSEFWNSEEENVFMMHAILSFHK